MSVEVYIPTPYRQYTGGESRVAAEGATVIDVLHDLAERHGELRERVLTDDGSIPGHLNIYVNEEEIRSLDGADTALSEGDELALIPAMAGGAQAGDDGRLLSDEQLDRYSRHIRLDEVGVQGQRQLLDSSVLVIGAGALGSPSSIYLAAAGVGTIGIVDNDRVERSNLHRQILHFDHDIGRPKTQSARRHLQDINPDVEVVTHETLLTSDNALEIIGDYDLVINGSDNFPTRYLVNDACVMLEKPLVDASILKFEAQATVFLPGQGCYRCLFPSPPPPGSVPSCAEAGIIGALAGHMGSLEVIEAVKVLLGVGETLNSRLLVFDALRGSYRAYPWERNPDCPVCGEEPEITALIDYEAFCGVPIQGDGPELDLQDEVATEAPAEGADAGRDAPLPSGTEVSAGEAAELVRAREIQLIDVREAREYNGYRIPGSVSIPLSELQEHSDEIDDDRPAIFVCTVGERSGVAAAAFRRAGHERAYNLRGGLMAWMNERLPLEQDDASDSDGGAAEGEARTAASSGAGSSS